MNTDRCNRAVLTLADGSICQIHDDATAVYPIKETDRSIASVQICSRTGFTVTQTIDYSIYARLPFPMNKERDITAIVCEALKCEPNCISEIIVDSYQIAARSDRTVCFISFYRLNHPSVIYAHEQDIGHTIMKQIVLDSDIDLFSFKWRHGFVRTVDGYLHSFGNRERHNALSISLDQPIVFHDVPGIREITCGQSYSLLLMLDGTVYAQGFNYDTRDASFEQIQFANSASINKIVTDSYHIIYISSAGTCYYSNTHEPIIKGRTGCMVPHILTGLQGYFVENAFILANCIIIQHDKGTISLVPLTRHVRFNAAIYYIISNKQIYNQKKPIALQYFNDKYVVNILQLGHHILFVTEDGCAYRSPISDNYYMNALVIEPVSFFTDNPIAVSSSTLRIPATQSILTQ